MLVPKAAFDLFEASSFNAKELVTSLVFAFRAKPGTVGLSAVPPKSWVNAILPFTDEVASTTPLINACCTKAVVAI